MKTVATHNGSYHADDVFAVATISILEKGTIQIIRTRDEEIINTADYVVDVGGIHDPETNRFDHHQKCGAGGRVEGDSIPYASFGLVWKAYGEQITGSVEVARSIDEYLVQSIDAPDNGVSLHTLTGKTSPLLFSSYIYSFQPGWKEDKETMDNAFEKAVSIAKEYLLRVIQRNTEYLEAKEKVVELYTQSIDQRILVLDRGYPWEGMLYDYEDVLFVVSPRTDGAWSVKGVPVKEGSFERRMYFPKTWAGLRDTELQNETKVHDALFCHNHLFIVVAQSKESAIMLARLALNQ
jgi:uncharacterized UPF0160 family protein